MYRLLNVQALAKFIVKVSFSDGVEGRIDLSDLVGKGVFSLWNDPSEFYKAFINPETYALSWPGNIDLCPDKIHQDLLKEKAD